MEHNANESIDKPDANNEKCGKCEKCCCRCHCRRCRLLAVVIVGVAIAASVCFYRSQSADSSASRYWMHHSAFRAHDGDVKQHADWVVNRLLSEVKANDDQKEKARQIVGAAAAEMTQLASHHDEDRKALVAILSAPEIDRAKLESWRVNLAKEFDGASLRLTTAAADLAEVLTPDQRAQLVRQVEQLLRP